MPDQDQQAAPFISVTLDATALMAQLERAPDIVNEELTRALEGVGARFETIGAEEAPEGALGGAGGLKGSVFAELRGSPFRELVAGWSAAYADYVVRGRRPGKMPPEAPIALWVQKVLEVGESDLATAVFLVRRAIGRRGTPGNPFDVRTLLRMEPIAQAELDAAAERVVARIEGVSG
jgi:hypothetical protein